MFAGLSATLLVLTACEVLETISTAVPATATTAPEAQPTATPTRSDPTPTPPAQVKLSVSSAELQPGDDLAVDVDYTPGGGGVSGVEITLTFDPGVFQVTSVKLGDLLGLDPVQLPQELDTNEGTLHLAAARKGATAVPGTSGTFATIEFSVLSTAQPRPYQMALSKVLVTNENFQFVDDISIMSAFVTIAP